MSSSAITPPPSVSDVRKLNAERIVAYVRKRGWITMSSRRSDVALFQKPDIRGGQIAIPLDPTFRDFEDRLRDVVNVVASVEATTSADLVKRVLLPDSDLVKWRRDDPAVTAGSLPLEDGIDFFEGARRAFLATAHTAISPSLYHPRLGRRDAEQYVDECRMGQTEESSFVATFFCPLNMPDDVNIPDEHFVATGLPFGRRVTQLLVEQFLRVTKAVHLQDVELLTKASIVTDVLVSGNFCEALIQMASPRTRELAITVDWSTSHPNAPARPEPLKGDDFAVVADFAQQLRPREEKHPQRFLGKIGTLTANPEKDRRTGGDVILHTITDDGPVRARLHLEADEYHVATRAHDESHYVEVHGVLVRKQGGARIAEPSGFHILLDSGQRSLT